MDAGVYDALHQLFTAAAEEGHGDADWTRIAEHVAARWSTEQDEQAG